MKHIKLFEGFNPAMKYKVIAVNMETTEAVGVFLSTEGTSKFSKAYPFLNKLGIDTRTAEEIYDSLHPKEAPPFFVYPMIDIPNDHDIVVCHSTNSDLIYTMSSKDLNSPAVGDNHIYQWPEDNVVYYRIDRDSKEFICVGSHGQVFNMSVEDVLENYNKFAKMFSQ